MDFQKDVLDFKGKVLVDFWAEWCGPCKTLSPIIEEIEKELVGNGLKPFRVVKIDVDVHSDIANQYNVSSIPTVMIFDNGKLVDTIVGYHQKQDYLKALML